MLSIYKFVSNQLRAMRRGIIAESSSSPENSNVVQYAGLPVDFDFVQTSMVLAWEQSRRANLVGQIIDPEYDDDHKTFLMLRILRIHITLFQRLMGLPRELRDTVYEQAFGNLPNPIVMRQFDTNGELTFPCAVPAFCYINRQVFEEALTAVFRNSAVTVRDSWNSSEVLTFTAILDQVPNGPHLGAFKGIKVLKIEGIRFNGKHSPVNDLIRRCTNLRHLTLQIHPIALLTIPPKTVSSAIGYLDLELQVPKSKLVPLLPAIWGSQTLELLTLGRDVLLEREEEAFKTWVEIYTKIITVTKSKVRVEERYLNCYGAHLHEDLDSEEVADITGRLGLAGRFF